MSEDALLTCIEQGVETHLLAETSDGLRVRFVHALIRAALYEGMLATRRRRLHGRIGETMAALRDPDPGAVAYQFQQAGDPRAVEWLIRAADQAERLAAWVTAALRCEAALALLDRRDTTALQRGWLCLRIATLHRFNDHRRARQLVDEAGQCLEAAGDTLLAAYHLLVSGNLHCISMDADRGVVELEAGRAALVALPPEQQRRVRQIPRGVRLSLDDDGESVLVLWLGNSGRNAAACAIGEQLIARTPGHTVSGRQEPARGGAYFGLGCAYAALGMPERARDRFAHSRAEYRAVGHYALVGAGILEDLRLVQLQYYTDDGAGRRRVVAEIDDTEARMGEAWMRQDRTHVAALQVCLLAGDWDAAQRSIEVVLSAGASGIPEPGSYGVADAAGATLAAARGDWQRAREMAAAFLPEGASTAPGKQIYLRGMHLQRTAIVVGLETGDLAMAFEWLRAHDRWLAWGAAVLGQAEGHILWARYHRKTGDPEQARARARQALACATDPRQPLALLAAHRLLGELDTDTRRYDDARAHLDAALALADACAVPFERALTLLAHAELHAATDDPAAARTRAEEVRRICLALGAHPTLARVAALLKHLTHAPAIPYPDGLSVREVEVLRRIASGRSNQEIANDLSLSVRTVERHMTNLYRKIGAHSKAQATAYALRHGLA